MIKQTYLILIDEAQRLRLIKVLEKSGINHTDDFEPLQYWMDMLTKLPRDEADQPNIIHGFCL